MKPSEDIERRTQRIARSMFKAVLDAGGLISFSQIAEARGMAILQYLDEQHEANEKQKLQAQLFGRRV